MKCSKCGGFVVTEPILTEGSEWIFEERCINCGERFYDQVEVVRRRELTNFPKGKEGKKKHENLCRSGSGEDGLRSDSGSVTP